MSEFQREMTNSCSVRRAQSKHNSVRNLITFTESVNFEICARAKFVPDNHY